MEFPPSQASNVPDFLISLKGMEENIQDICKAQFLPEDVIRELFAQVKEGLNELDSRDNTANINISLTNIQVQTAARLQQKPDKDSERICLFIQRGVKDCLNILEKVKQKKTIASEDKYLSGEALEEPTKVKVNPEEQIEKTKAYHKEAIARGEEQLKANNALESQIRDYVRNYCEGELTQFQNKIRSNNAYLIRHSSTIKDDAKNLAFVIQRRLKTEGKWKMEYHLFRFNLEKENWIFKNKEYNKLEELIKAVVPNSTACPPPSKEQLDDTVQRYMVD